VTDPHARANERVVLPFWCAVAVAALVWLTSVFWLVAANPRLLASWHGFLHAGIAARFPSMTWAPENPFFAGEVVAYYWVYQWFGYLVSRFCGLDLLHAFQLITLASLVLLVVAGALAGRSLYRSTPAALLVSYLALLGVNPLGPAIAAAKVVARGQPLMHHERQDPPGDVFVSNVSADDRMARPLLGALYIETDWRRGQNIVWFFDVSSRGPTLALLLVLAWLLLQPAASAWVSAGLVVAGTLATALNPIVGLAAAGLIGAGAGAMWLWEPAHSMSRTTVARAALILGGALLALPTYAHLARFPGALALSSTGQVWLKSLAMIAGFLVLGPLAVQGTIGAPAERRPAVAALTIAGLLMIAVVPVAALSEANEHNFANAACCLLAPAAAWIAGPRGVESTSGQGVRAAVLAAVFVPMTLATVVAFSGRPPVPLTFERGLLRRVPPGNDLDTLYRWIETSTAPTAVLVVDPLESVKMAGNVSEIPAFTHRALFVDQPTYMTSPYPDLARRIALASAVTAGTPLTAEQLGYLRELGRPAYILTLHADRADLFARLVATLGSPSFHKGRAAVFSLDAGHLAGGRNPGAMFVQRSDDETR
jgi:hypothetical protein